MRRQDVEELLAECDKMAGVIQAEHEATMQRSLRCFTSSSGTAWSGCCRLADLPTATIQKNPSDGVSG